MVREALVEFSSQVLRQLVPQPEPGRRWWRREVHHHLIQPPRPETQRLGGDTWLGHSAAAGVASASTAALRAEMLPAFFARFREPRDADALARRGRAVGLAADAFSSRSAARNF
jgi:hypothetical protein